MLHLFFELLQISLGMRDNLSRVPTEIEWLDIFCFAQKQAVLGIMIEGLEKLPKKLYPSKELMLQWVGYSQMGESTYSLHLKRAKVLAGRIQTAGFRSCVIKGVALAQLYPKPERRECGDIDVWIEGNEKAIMAWLKPYHTEDQVVWHHVVTNFFEDVPTEIHLHPSWLHNPIRNKRLQAWFESVKSGQMVVDEKLGFAVPDVDFNAVYSLVHTFHHLLEEGVGLRHIIDYYYILLALPQEKRTGVVRNLRSLGLMKLAAAVMWVLQDVCGMSSDYLLCEPNEKEGRFLLKEIIDGGNFGRYREGEDTQNTTSRMLTMLLHYPNEVLWVLPWKVWHKAWRLFRKKQ